MENKNDNQIQQEENNQKEENKKTDNELMILKKEELLSEAEKKFQKVNKELINLKKTLVKSILNKYEIYSDIDLNKIDYSNGIEDLENSVLTYCELNRIKYKKQQEAVSLQKNQNISQEQQQFHIKRFYF